MKKYLFNFEDSKIKNLKNKKNILGGKGANLAEMGKLGLPVPPGFTISTEVCDFFYSNSFVIIDWIRFCYIYIRRIVPHTIRNN